MNLGMLCTTYVPNHLTIDLPGSMWRWITWKHLLKCWKNWCWEKQVLKRVSGHYQDMNQTLPDEMIENIIKSKNLGIGLDKLRQIAFGVFDMLLHTTAKIETPNDISELFSKVRKEYSLIEAAPGTNFAASFMHLCAGYDAGYYGYLWSEVFCADLYSRFLSEGVLNTQVGLDYRRMILEPGASKNGMDMIESFLGRKPTEDSFIKSLGL